MLKSKATKEVEKKMLIRKTIASMDKQINKLEEQKAKYLETASIAKQQGLSAQYDLALSALKMTIAQQKKVYEMKLNFEITSQMKDMSMMTSEFLSGMGLLSKEMLKLTKEKDFLKIEKEFNMAMDSTERQAMMMENFLDETQSTFSAQNVVSKDENAEIEKMIDNKISGDSISNDVDSELADLLKKVETL